MSVEHLYKLAKLFFIGENIERDNEISKTPYLELQEQVFAGGGKSRKLFPLQFFGEIFESKHYSGVANSHLFLEYRPSYLSGEEIPKIHHYQFHMKHYEAKYENGV